MITISILSPLKTGIPAHNYFDHIVVALPEQRISQAVPELSLSADHIGNEAECRSYGVKDFVDILGQREI
jgi:hypothetical protein